MNTNPLCFRPVYVLSTSIQYSPSFIIIIIILLLLLIIIIIIIIIIVTTFFSSSSLRIPTGVCGLLPRRLLA